LYFVSTNSLVIDIWKLKDYFLFLNKDINGSNNHEKEVAFRLLLTLAGNI